MAQLHYEAYHAPQHSGTPQVEPRGPGRAGSFVNFIGALVSVALVGGVGVWSYRLMVRDVSGVPVIRALAGPYRVIPEDPGGLQASYQGLAVNTVAAEGSTAGTAQSIALAPPPVELSAEDRAAAALIASNSQPITAPPAVLEVPEPTQTADFQSPAPIQAPTPVEREVVIAAPAPITEPAPTQQLALIPSSRPGVSRSLVPRRRPGDRVSAPVLAAAAQTQGDATSSDAQAEAVLQELVTRLGPARTVEIDPASLSPGTRLVQLGAYDSDAEARMAWDTLANRYPAYLQDRGRIIESASAGGRTFYRLRAHGFVDEPEARRFCSVFLADNVDCIPVLIR